MCLCCCFYLGILCYMYTLLFKSFYCIYRSSYTQILFEYHLRHPKRISLFNTGIVWWSLPRKTSHCAKWTILQRAELQRQTSDHQTQTCRHVRGSFVLASKLNGKTIWTPLTAHLKNNLRRPRTSIPLRSKTTPLPLESTKNCNIVYAAESIPSYITHLFINAPKETRYTLEHDQIWQNV